jgi:hypothetical protein
MTDDLRLSTSFEANLGDTTTGGARGQGWFNHRGPIAPDDSAVPGSVPTRSPQKPAYRIAERVVDVSLRGKAAVFHKSPPQFASAKDIRPIRKCLCRVRSPAEPCRPASNDDVDRTKGQLSMPRRPIRLHKRLTPGTDRAHLVDNLARLSISLAIWGEEGGSARPGHDMRWGWQVVSSESWTASGSSQSFGLRNDGFWQGERISGSLEERR